MYSLYETSVNGSVMFCIHHASTLTQTVSKQTNQHDQSMKDDHASDTVTLILLYISHFPAHMSLGDPSYSYMPIYIIKYLHSVPYPHANPVACSLYRCLSSATSCYPEITSIIIFYFFWCIIKGTVMSPLLVWRCFVKNVIMSYKIV